jgi:hypothetical protein
MTPDYFSTCSPVHDATPDGDIPGHPLKGKKSKNKKGLGTNISTLRLYKRKQDRTNTQLQDSDIKVDWGMFPKATEFYDNSFSSEDSKELFVAGLEEMAPNRRRFSLAKIFLNDRPIRPIPNRRSSIEPKKRT